jgi:hypothetical protein
VKVVDEFFDFKNGILNLGTKVNVLFIQQKVNLILVIDFRTSEKTDLFIVVKAVLVKVIH